MTATTTTTGPVSALEVRGLRHAYGPVEVLHGLDLTVAPGAVLAVLGPSGCGKSTLLRLVAGFEAPRAGSVTLGGRLVAGSGRWVPTERRPIGYVAQEGALFPHLSVRRNLEFGLDRRSRRQPHRLVELLELVSLGPEHLDRYPHELSGGQQQRVALARTLARRPAVVLLDEPFTALDAELRVTTRTAVAEALRAAAVTTVLVTHDQSEALSFADEIAVMSNGRFAQVAAATEVYEHPADLEVARLVGGAVVMPGTVAGSRVETALGPVPLRTPAPAGPAQVMLRPEQLSVRPEPAPGSATGTVTAMQYFGHDRVLEVSWPGAPSVRVRVAGQLDCEVGDPVAVKVQGTALAFPPD